MVNIYDKSVLIVFPYILKRPYIPIFSDTELEQFAPFIAIGPQIYVDGLIVLEKESHKLIGRIACRHVLSHLVNKSYSKWQNITANQVMQEVNDEDRIDIESPISKVIEFFKRTRFAFAPVTKNERVVATLTVRDFLHIVKDTDKSNYPVSDVSSKLISIDKRTDILEAIEIMLEKGIRNIGIKDNEKDSDLLGVVNDRKILEFLLSYDGMRLISNGKLDTNSSIPIDKYIDIQLIGKIKYNEPLKAAADLLDDVRTPFLILEGKEEIVTPWDIVIK